MKKKFMELIAIDSGEVCPDTGTWYANLKKETDYCSFDFIKRFRQGEKFTKLNDLATKWTYHVEIS